MGAGDGLVFGYSVAISANGMVIASGNPDLEYYGITESATLYNWTDGEWDQKGQSLHGDEFMDYFGHDIDISADGNKVIIGATTKAWSGYARVFSFNSSLWNQLGPDIDQGTNRPGDGHSVAMSADGSSVAVSASSYVDFEYGGHVGVYQILQTSTSLNELDESSITLWPNPSVKELFISSVENNEIDYILVHDLKGNEVEVGLVKTAKGYQVDISSLPNATYSVLVSSRLGQIVRQIVKTD